MKYLRIYRMIMRCSKCYIIPSSKEGSSIQNLAVRDNCHVRSLINLAQYTSAHSPAILPVYFTATFTHVASPPTLYYPMPPLAPFPPMPGEIPSPSKLARPNGWHVPQHTTTARSSPPAPSASSDGSKPKLSSSRSASSSLTSTRVSELRGVQPQTDAPSAEIPDPPDHKSTSPSTDSVEPSSTGKPTVLPSLAKPSEAIHIGGSLVCKMFEMRTIAELDEHRLYMHLYRSAGVVFAMKETIWDELWILVRRRDVLLMKYGWVDDEYTLQASRQRFEAMWERYRM